jgi:TRAP transporter TAXI family solute receptor
MALACAGALIASFAAVGPAAAQKAIRLGTSSIGSSFYATSVGMSQLIQKYAGMNVTVEPLGGSDANVFGIAAGRIDVAMTNSGASYDGYHGVKPFKKKIGMRLLMQGNPTLRWFLVRNGSGISKPADLVGKTVSASRRALPELQQILNALIKVYGLPSVKIKQVSSVTSGDVSHAFRAGTIDAASFPFALRQPIASRLFADKIVSALMIPDDKFHALKSLLPDKFSELKVPANNFENQPKPFLALKMTTQLTALAKTPEDEAYKIVKAILGHHDEFVTAQPSARPWTVKNTLEDPKIPFHPGAVRYFKEIGAWTPALDAMQAKLLKAQ